MTSERATSSAVTPLMPGPLAVDLDAHGRVVEGLGVLEVAERGDLRQLVPDLRRVGPVSAKFGPLTATSTGVGEPKLITSLTMSAGSKENCTSGISAGELVAEPPLQGLDVDAGLVAGGRPGGAPPRARRSTGRWR